MAFWTGFVIFLLLLGESLCQDSDVVITGSRNPFDNPVPADTEFTMSGVWDLTWDTCEWHRVDPQTQVETLHCTSRKGPDPVDCTGTNFTQSGGIPEEHKCNLIFETVTAEFAGTWKLYMKYLPSGSGSSIQSTFLFNLEVTKPADVALYNDFGDVSDSILEIRNGERVSYRCNSVFGVPRSDSFNWTIDDEMTFMTDNSWQAFTYPIEHTGGSNVSQVLSLVAPSVIRSFVLKCGAIQFDYSYITEANVTLKVIDESTEVLSGEMIAVISVSTIFFIFAVIVFACLACFCLKCFCFGKKEPRRTYNNNSNNNRTTSSNPVTVTDTFATKRPNSSMANKSYIENGVEVDSGPVIPPRRSAFTPTGYNDYRTEHNRYQQQPQYAQSSKHHQQPVNFNQSINTTGLVQPQSRLGQYNFSTRTQDGSGRGQFNQPSRDSKNLSSVV